MQITTAPPAPPTAPSQAYRTLLTVQQFADKHPAFHQGSLRTLIFLAESRPTPKRTIPGNGLSVALVRLGRKVLIDEERFFQWVQRQQEKG